MLTKKTRSDDTKALLQSHESKLDRHRVTMISPLPNVNVTTKNYSMINRSLVNNDAISQL